MYQKVLRRKNCHFYPVAASNGPSKDCDLKTVYAADTSEPPSYVQRQFNVHKVYSLSLGKCADQKM